MLKRELKINLKPFIVWTLTLIVIFLIVYLMYPSIINSDNIKMIDEMMKIFPEEVLKAFNMDIASMNSAFGWLKSEGFIFVLLITGCYSSLLGANILLKEENDKTIEYLHSLPIKRNNIISSKVITGLIYIFLMILIIAIFNYIGLCLSGEFDKKQYLLLSITPIFSSLVLYFLSMYISTLANKNKKILGLSLGITLISYVLQTVSLISKETEFLKYITPFTLADTRNIILNTRINPIMIFISISLSIIFLILTIIKYNKKELV